MAQEATIQNTKYPFPHDRLQVFLVALAMAGQTKTIGDEIPRGYRSLADQLIRASSSVVLNIPKGHRFRTSGLGPLKPTILARAPTGRRLAPRGSATPKPEAKPVRSPPTHSSSSPLNSSRAPAAKRSSTSPAASPPCSPASSPASTDEAKAQGRLRASCAFHLHSMGGTWASGGGARVAAPLRRAGPIRAASLSSSSGSNQHRLASLLLLNEPWHIEEMEPAINGLVERHEDRRWLLRLALQ